MNAMVKRIMQRGIIFVICLALFNPQTASAEGNIDSIYKYALSENSGWENFRSTHGGVTVNDTYLSGYVWSENIGWLKLGSGTGPYVNDAADNWGVNHNSATGALSGYAWSENAGWINFNATEQNPNGLSIDPNTLKFDGYAWAENIGYIHFQNASPEYYVKQEASAPMVTTQAVSNIAVASAIGNGNITSLGAPNPTEHGVCWSTSVNPTIACSKTQQGPVAAIGEFPSTMAALSPSTTYYVRAYATNTVATFYGGEVSFITLPNPPSVPAATAATSVAKTSFAANWNAATGATGYRLDVATDNGFTNFVGGYENKDVGSATTFPIIGLSAATDYFYRVRAENTGGTTGNSNTINVTTIDGTGVPAEIQDATPNGGDGNGDGIQDSKQTTVASLPSATGEGYLTVEISGCGQIQQVESYTYGSVGVNDPGYSYPFGLLGFEIPCSSAMVRIYYHEADTLEGYTYRKYGPTPDDWNASLWYTMPGVTFGTETIGEKTVPYVEFTLTEGWLGDDTNGFTIIDQGGPGLFNAVSVPTLSEWGMIILFLLTIFMALGAIRRQRVRG